jgi:acyl-CoA reductase-like NAD-dependent aldehyde dehydrogenase
VNPRTGKPGGATFEDGSRKQITAAVTAAERAFGRSRNFDQANMAVALRAIATELNADGEQLMGVALRIAHGDHTGALLRLDFRHSVRQPPDGDC